MKHIGVFVRGVAVALALLSACSVPSVNFTGTDGGGDDDDDTDAMPDTPGVVDLVVSTNSVTVGEALTQTFTVQLSAAPASSVLVSIDSADDNSVGVTPTSIQFDGTNWSQARTVTLSGREDADTQSEMVDVTLSSSVGNETVAVTVTDNDTLRIIATPSTDFQVDEGGTSTLAVHLSAQPTGPVTVMVMSSDTSAATVSPATLSFGTGTWDLDQQVVVSGIDDADVLDDAAMVMLTATDLTGTVVPVAVVDDDVLGIVPSTSNLGTLNEGGTTTFTVRLSQQPPSAVAVAVASSDTMLLTATPTPLNFTTANWMTPQTVTVNLPQDVDVVDETASISLTAATLTTRTVSASIDDDDTQTVLAAPDPVDVIEGMSRNFNVRLQFQPASDVTLTVTSLNTALATVAPASVTFTPGNYNTNQPVVVTAPQDVDVSSGLTAIRLESLPDALMRDVSVAVTDDDQLLIETTTVSVTLGEAGTAMFGVRLSAMPGAAVTVNASSGDSTIATVSPAQLMFTTANYNTYQMVTVTGVADSDLADENITLTLAAAGVPNKTLDAAVTDDDMQRVVVSSSTISVNEGGSGTIGVSLGFVPLAATTVNLASSDMQGATVTPATLNFTPANYATPQNITIAGVSDADGVDDTVTVNATATGATAAAIAVTVQDDDVLGIETSTTTVTVGEAGTASFNVRLSAMPLADTTVMVMSSDVTAATAAPAMLTFTTANYNIFQPVTLTGVGDADAVNDNINVTLTATGLTTRTVTTTVNDDDTQDILLTSTTLTVGEAGTGTFGVRLAAMPTSNVAVSVASFNTSKATASPATLTFTAANYATNQTVTVSGVADLDMAQESVAINMTSPTLTTRTVTTTVNDDDTQVVETTTPGPTTVAEGSTFTAGFRLRYIPAANVTVTVTLGAGLSSPTTTLTFTPANYNTAQSAVITGAQDADAADVTTTVTATAPSATSAVINVTVDDDDVLGLDTSVSSFSVNEGANQTFGVRLTAQPAGDTVVGISSSDAAVASVNAPTSLTFTTSNWNTYQNASIAGVEDVDITADAATITVASVGLTSKTVGVTINDNDTLTIVANPASVSILEGANNTFGVTLSNQPTSTVTVNLGTSDSAVVTIVNAPATLTFDTANWSTSQTVVLLAPQDADANNGSANVVLTSASTATKNVPVSVGDDDITLTDLSVQMGPTTGGGSATATGTGFTASVTGTMSGNAVGSWNAASGTSGTFTIPGKTAGSTNWSDLRLVKGANQANIPRAHYYGTWNEPATAISGGTVNAIHRASTTVMYAATNEGVYRSDNDGVAWVRASGGLPGGAVQGLSGSTTQMYAATSGGIYTTTDAGATWTLAGGLTGSAACVFNFAGTTNVVACVGSDVYRSSDGGANWIRALAGVNTPKHIRGSGTGVAWLATSAGVYRSPDSGVTWAAANGNIAAGNVVTVGCHPTNGDTIAFMAIGTNVYYSTDGGALWTAQTVSGTVTSIAVSNQQGSYAYMGTSAGVYRQQWSNPSSWTLMSTGIPSQYSIKYAIIGGTAGHAFVATNNGGIYSTTQTANAWNKRDTSGLNAWTATAVATHPTTPGTAMVSNAMGLWRTTDHGATFTNANGGVTITNTPTALAYAPSLPSTVYAGYNGAGVWKSTDGGLNWAATGLAGVPVNSISVDPSNANLVVVGLLGSGCVQRSTNGGTSFTASATGLNCTSSVVGVVHINSSTVFALELNNGVWRSTDGGINWSAYSTGFPAGGSNTLKADAAGNVYAINGANGVYRLPAGSSTWANASGVVSNYAVDPTRTATSYFIGNNNGTNNFRRSLTSFATRIGFATGLPQSVFTGQVAIDSGGSTVYFAPTNAGLYRVND
ncbi:MAG TPA: hypothetical protein VM261_17370 [Kofleriaceae bacterium]|nr:hypothetical protein [Kofleriaceae bacterium]